MYVHSRFMSIAYKLCVAAVGAAALLHEFGVGQGRLHPDACLYFTNISNIAVVLYLLFAASAQCRRPSDWAMPSAPLCKHMLTLGITVTFPVAHFLLDHGMVFTGGKFHWAKLVVHYIVPIGMVLDWLLFDRKGTMGFREPLIWPLFPLAYFGYVALLIYGFGVRVRRESRWPYDFIDVDRYGVGHVLLTVAVLLVVFVGLGYMGVLADRLLGRAPRS